MKDSSKLVVAGAALTGLLAMLKSKAKKVAGIGKLNRNNTDYRSGYQICWIVLIPTSGIATKHDEKLLGQYPFWFKRMDQNEVLVRHTPNRWQAERVLEMLEDSVVRSKLDKTYSAYIMSDKQFGLMGKERGSKAFLDVMTTMQKEQMVKI